MSSMNETSVYVDTDPTITEDDVRSAAAAVLNSSDLLGNGSWEVVADTYSAPGSTYAVDIDDVRNPALTELAHAVRDAVAAALGVRVRMEYEVPELAAGSAVQPLSQSV
ncbi:hypothetical protein JVX90_00260 [Gordonia sp. PDNC005]|uniref:hypothetical protein n=1 Tax=Gordonia sp. PDNC005 TaxID=2811424 RepID=UPI0019662EC8|nr:hypothetical protein [Gordonia sp. PDNC005]QRY62745.1 hypothetical protein JVX90_00260 [Gordonia sp. PDNC005]